jgi:superfamily II helicase
VREVETKLQPAAMLANPPGSTPEKHKNLRVLHSIDEVSSCNQCFLRGEFSYYGYRKTWKILENLICLGVNSKILEKIAKVSKPRISKIY